MACIGMHERGAGSHRSSVALRLVTVPGCTRGKVHLQNAATMERTMSHRRLPKHQLKRAGRVTQVSANTRPGEHKTNQNNKRVQHKCREGNARFFSRERKRQFMRATACNNHKSVTRNSATYLLPTNWLVTRRHLPSSLPARGHSCIVIYGT